MEELWPAPTPEVAAAIRLVCQRLLPDAEAVVDALSEPAMEAQYDAALASDASLAEEDRELNRSDLLQWVTSNIQHPGLRVEPYVGPRAVEYISDLVARGIEPNFAEGWRAALSVAWRFWLDGCAAHCDSTELLVDVLDVSAKSMIQYALDSIAVLREASLTASTGNADDDAIAIIQLIASGAPMTEDLAESRLRHRMARWHVGVVLWTNELQHVAALDEVISEVRSESAERALVARASPTSRWVWLSSVTAPDVHRLEKLVMSSDVVRATTGRPGRGLEGFRSSHQDALAAQALLVRLASTRRFVAYADVELIDAMTKDREVARRFVTKTLGPLAEADEALRQTLLTYVRCGSNTRRAAAELYAHRNTVERRVSRANELSTVKVEDNPIHVAAALLVLDMAPDIMSPGRD